MRSLVVFFFFIIFFFGVGTIILSIDTESASNTTDFDYSLAQITTGNQQVRASISTEVDRDDDSDSNFACTSAPNDCNLRSAINIANTDGKQTAITFAGNYMIHVSRPLPSLAEDNTVIKARPEQEVHINGNGSAGSVLRVTGAHVQIQGLRIYGAGDGYPNIAVSDNAYDTVIANNVIGDDDAPNGNCGSSEGAYGGIYIDATGDFEGGHRAWIYGNVIECNRGIPGDGITVRSNKVIIGKDQNGNGSDAQRNIIRLNNGFGVNLTDTTDNTICDNDLVANVMGGLYISNFHNNNIMFNEIVDNSSTVN
jgi:hypothetical protein